MYSMRFDMRAPGFGAAAEELYEAALDMCAWSAGIADVSDIDELRAMSRTHRIFTADEAIAYVRGGGMLTLAPLGGGIPPDIAWKYLRYVDEAVMPALVGAGNG
jgi:hypothetical protein